MTVLGQGRRLRWWDPPFGLFIVMAGAAISLADAGELPIALQAAISAE